MSLRPNKKPLFKTPISQYSGMHAERVIFQIHIYPYCSVTCLNGKFARAVVWYRSVDGWRAQHHSGSFSKTRSGQHCWRWGGKKAEGAVMPPVVPDHPMTPPILPRRTKTASSSGPGRGSKVLRPGCGSLSTFPAPRHTVFILTVTAGSVTLTPKAARRAHAHAGQPRTSVWILFALDEGNTPQNHGAGRVHASPPSSPHLSVCANDTLR